ncbi:hypothetical protein D3C76_1529110 [compost metagenome]
MVVDHAARNVNKGIKEPACAVDGDRRCDRYRSVSRGRQNDPADRAIHLAGLHHYGCSVVPDHACIGGAAVKQLAVSFLCRFCA